MQPLWTGNQKSIKSEEVGSRIKEKIGKKTKKSEKGGEKNRKSKKQEIQKKWKFKKVGI